MQSVRKEMHCMVDQYRIRSLKGRASVCGVSNYDGDSSWIGDVRCGQMHRMHAGAG